VLILSQSQKRHPISDLFSPALASLKSAPDGPAQQQNDSGDDSEEENRLHMDVKEREEKLDAVLTRVHNCMLSSQKLNTQILLMLKGWKASL
jgi:hypothetical protein